MEGIIGGIEHEVRVLFTTRNGEKCSGTEGKGGVGGEEVGMGFRIMLYFRVED